MLKSQSGKYLAPILKVPTVFFNKREEKLQNIDYLEAQVKPRQQTISLRLLVILLLILFKLKNNSVN